MGVGGELILLAIIFVAESLLAPGRMEREAKAESLAREGELLEQVRVAQGEKTALKAEVSFIRLAPASSGRGPRVRRPAGVGHSGRSARLDSSRPRLVRLFYIALTAVLDFQARFSPFHGRYGCLVGTVPTAQSCTGRPERPGSNALALSFR